MVVYRIALAWLGIVGVLCLVSCQASTLTPSPLPSDSPTLHAMLVATISPTATVAVPTATVTLATSTPSPTPELPLLVPRLLSAPGCCVQPSWRADSLAVEFIDQAAGASQADVYQIFWQTPQPPVGYLTPSARALPLGYYSDDFRYRAALQHGQTWVSDLHTGEQWPIENDGHVVTFAPNSPQLLWASSLAVVDGRTATDRRPVTVWYSIIGGEPQEILQLIGGGLPTWLDDNRFLVLSRADIAAPRHFAVYDLRDGSYRILVTGERFWGGQVSPLGNWLLYALVFSDPAEAMGWYVVPTSGIGVAQPLPVWGSPRWQDEDHLLFWLPVGQLPTFEHNLPPAVAYLWQYQLSNQQLRPLARVAGLPAQNDWAVSPDGQRIVYLVPETFQIGLLTLSDLGNP